MNLLYVTALNLDSNSGAIEHVLGIAQGLAELGHRVHLVAAAKTDQVLQQKTEGLVTHVVTGGSSAARTAALVAEKALQVIRDVPVDLVYLRPFPLDYLLLTRKLVKRKLPYVCELNDMTYQEYKAKGQPWRGRLYQYFERFTFRNSAGWLPVTSEIYNSAQKVAGREKPYRLTGNGVQVDEIVSNVSRAKKRMGMGVPEDRVVLVMAGFASPWQGVDRLISLFAELQKVETVELWLIGAQGERDFENVAQLAKRYQVNDSVRVFPWLSQEETADLVAAADIGIGSLALDRKEMWEAQPLKVRFYLALGLPVLLNFHDPRLAMYPAPFIAQIASTDPNVLANGVQSLISARLLRAQIRDYAQEHLSWRSISRETESFLATTLKGAEWYGSC